jgi:molybdate transport system substrate-binding protein
VYTIGNHDVRRIIWVLMASLGLHAGLLLAQAGAGSGATEPGANGARRAAGARAIVVFAAASLSDALTEVGNAFTSTTGVSVKPSFAASSVLAKQIESGAAASVFFSADEEWMDYLESRHLLAPGSRRDVLANRLALIAPADSPAAFQITSGPALLQALGSARIATGDPDSVPAGKYARAALTKLGVWNALQPRLIPAENVRSALAYVARGEAPFGIVYLTDAQVEKKVKLVALFPDDTHAPIRYPIARTVATDASAARFVEFVASPRAQAIFQKYGFAPAH